MEKNSFRRYKRLSHLAAIVLIVAAIAFFVVSVVSSTRIYEEVVNIKEHPFPVSNSAAQVKSSINELHTLTERLHYIQTDEVINNVRGKYEQIEEECEPLIQNVVDRYLVDPPAAKVIQKEFYTLMDNQYTFLDMCADPNTSEEEIDAYANEVLHPMMDNMQSELDILIANATDKFDSFVNEADEHRNLVFITSSILAIFVIITIFIYIFIINRKDKEQAKLMKDMEVALAASKAANNAKSQFLSSMSHDIRTPMNAIVGMTAIAGKEINNPTQVKNCLDKISSSSKLLLNIINDVLDMSKIESGKIIINEDEFNLSDLFNTVVDVVRPQIKSKKQSLEIEISGIKDEEVKGDAVRLQQVLINLLSNAIKFTPLNGKIKILLMQESSPYSDYENYTFVVSDNGIGMSEEFVKNVFDPFERENNENTDKIEGTGLGLAIAKSMIEMMGGTISVESKLGEGSAFTVTLPFKAAGDKANEKSELLRDLQVLVVDDEQDVCENTVEILEDLGMKGRWVLSGVEAIVHIAQTFKEGLMYNAVIIDWKMPDMDGVETAKRIRQAVGDDTPIIILTAYDWHEIEEEARASGVTAFLEKPLFKSRLKNTMLEAFGDGAPVEENDPFKDFKKSGKVLIVEDNEINIEIIKTIIESFGIETEVARDGKQGVTMFEALDDNYFDMILMDIQMPVMGGYDATRAIRAYETAHGLKETPIVALSANAFADDVNKAKSVHMNDYLIKPINMDNLKKILDKYL